MIDLVEQLHGYGEQLLSELDRADAEASKGGRRLVQEPALATGDLTSEVDVCEAFGAEITVFDLRGPAESPVPRPPKRRALVLAVAAAAAILVVAGVVVVADQTDSNLVTEPVSSATTAEPVRSPSVTDPVVSSDRSGVFGDGVEGRSHLASVVAAGPGFVAAGVFQTPAGARLYEDAAVWTSVDGTTWSRIPHDAAVFSPTRVQVGQGMTNLTTGGPGLVAVGWLEDSPDFSDPGVAAVVWTSVDGVTWSLVPHDEEVFGGPGNQAMSSVVAGGPGLVAVGHDGGGYDRSVDAAVWTSVDGFTWARVPHDEAVFGGAEMYSVVAGGPGLVAVGSNGVGGDNADGQLATEADKNFTTDAVVWTSVDGITWSRVPHDEAVFGGPGDQSMNKVVAAGPGLVAVGVGGGGNDDNVDAAVWTSVDGITWSRVPHDEAIFGGAGRQEMSDVTVGGPGFVAVGFDGRCLPDVCQDVDAAVWVSADGITWARVATSDEVFAVAGSQSMSSVAATNGTLVAVGRDQTGDLPPDGDYGAIPLQAAVWTSTDGTTWSRVALDTETADEDG